jgi:hypothetical protein
MSAISLDPSPARRDALARRIRLLVAATIAYKGIDAAVALTAGALASSTALIGFGLDSVIEVSSAAAVAWQFSARDHAVREAREKKTLRIIAFSFFALALYVALDSVRALTGTGEAGARCPASSLPPSPWDGVPRRGVRDQRLGVRGRLPGAHFYGWVPLPEQEAGHRVTLLGERPVQPRGVHDGPVPV